jgi:hypothetical protein
MEKNTALRWLLAFSSFVIFLMPVLLADELTLLQNWLLIFTCWFIIIANSAYRAIHNDYIKRAKTAFKKNKT